MILEYLSSIVFIAKDHVSFITFTSYPSFHHIYIQPDRKQEKRSLGKKVSPQIKHGDVPAQKMRLFPAVLVPSFLNGAAIY
jgi:hypothetical protein